MTEWTRKSMYHLVGPDGWSICCVRIDGEKWYELWQTMGWNDHKCHHRAKTADECKLKFEDITNAAI